jgi:Uma2 family endonuclease
VISRAAKTGVGVGKSGSYHRRERRSAALALQRSGRVPPPAGRQPAAVALQNLPRDFPVARQAPTMASSSSMRLEQYLAGPEYPRHRELIWGVVREPPSPFAPHQLLVTQIAALLHEHVRQHDLGRVLVSPMDVILDEANALVLQPDVMFISRERASIIRDFVWGAPDLVVEVASRGTARYDRGSKTGWYRRYGVRECWIVEPERLLITIIDMSSGDLAARECQGAESLRSKVLPAFTATAADLLGL